MAATSSHFSHSASLSLDSLFKKALSLFKIDLVLRTLEKEHKTLCLDEAISEMSVKAVKSQARLMETNILSVEDSMELCVTLYSMAKLGSLTKGTTSGLG